MHALGVAPPRAVRARLGVLLGGLSAIQPEEARLVAEVVERHAQEAIGRGLVRTEHLDERVAPGGGVGVEVLVDERVGAEVRADAQIDTHDLAVGRAALARYILDQARAPAHAVHVPLPHGEAKVVDARVLGPDVRVRIGGSSGGGRVIWVVLVGTNTKAGYL
jgi:hypothetical protein